MNNKLFNDKMSEVTLCSGYLGEWVRQEITALIANIT